VLLVVATATVGTAAWSAQQSVAAQREFDGVIIAELLARSARFADDNARDIEEVVGEQMVVEATLAAHLVAVAEAGGARPDAINARLRDISQRTVLSEFWITDEKGQAYLRNLTDVDFAFSPDPAKQPQAHVFWPLITGQQQVVIQEARRREIDDKSFKYVGVAGVDKPRIVQVGYPARFLERLQEEGDLSDLVTELVAGGRIASIHVVDTAQKTRAFAAGPGHQNARDLGPAERALVQQALNGRRAASGFDGSALRVAAPMLDPRGQPVGAVIVRLPGDGGSAMWLEAARVGGFAAIYALAGVVAARLILRRSVARTG
jgi:hypothetical protein